MTKEMSVFLNSMEITPNVSIVNETFNTLEVTVLKGSNNSFSFSFPRGIGLTTTVTSGILSVVLTVPEDLNGITQGLLGNFNGNIIDDLMYPNGTVLTDGASDREIHDFGQSCEFVLTLKVRNIHDIVSKNQQYQPLCFTHSFTGEILSDISAIVFYSFIYRGDPI